MKSSNRLLGRAVLALVVIASTVGTAAVCAQTRKGTVTASSLAVYPEMSTDRDLVETLQHGTEVQILFMLTTGDGTWCSVARADSTIKLGYVDCRGLTIAAAPGAPASTSASATAPARSPATREQKAWVLAASAIAATANREGTSTFAANTPGRAKEILALGWEVHNRDDLFNTLNKLEQGQEGAMFSAMGARASSLSEADFSKALNRLSPVQARAAKIAREYYPRYQTQSLIGWEYARYINVCRWGVSAGYIKEDEAWPLAMNAARILQGSFGSWEEFGENYLVGRKFVPPIEFGPPPPSVTAVYAWLKTNPASPWQRVPWNLPLN